MKEDTFTGDTRFKIQPENPEIKLSTGKKVILDYTGLRQDLMQRGVTEQPWNKIKDHFETSRESIGRNAETYVQDDLYPGDCVWNVIGSHIETMQLGFTQENFGKYVRVE